MRNFYFFFLFTMLISGSLFSDSKTVIFDFGGVMTEKADREGILDFIKNRIQDPEIKPDKKKKKKKGVSTGDGNKSFRSFVEEIIGINKEMYALVRKLKGQNIQVGILSNIDSFNARTLKDCGFFEDFDFCFLSCEVGVEKPNKRIYEILQESLNVPMQEIVFIDDRLENVQGAHQLGIDAILFFSAKQIEEELVQRDIMTP